MSQWSFGADLTRQQLVDRLVRLDFAERLVRLGSGQEHRAAADVTADALRVTVVQVRQYQQLVAERRPRFENVGQFEIGAR